MSLFDDEFYSTRVSRRTRWANRDKKSLSSSSWRGRKWSNTSIALTSSLASALVAVLLFGLFTGFDRGGSAAAGLSTPVTAVKAADPLEKTIQAAAKVRPAVVSIINEQSLPSSADGSDPGTSPDSGSADKGSDGLAQAALGSGFIFEKVKGKALIITNYHVIADAEAVKAVLSDGETRDAKIIGKDQITDLAVLEIDGKGISTVAEFGDSDRLQAGQWVMAIGNPLGLSDSLSMGIVSKTKRVIPVSLSQDGVYDWEQEVIQIDASINQGNSGGPLIDLDGKVVGINSMKVADFGVEGVGFAIPSDAAMPIVQDLLKYGKVNRPYLGVYTMDLQQYFAQQAAGSAGGSNGSGDSGNGASPDAGGNDPSDSGDDVQMPPPPDLKLPKDVKSGVIVLQAVGPAEKAGLKLNDVIVKLDKQPIGSTLDLRKYLYDNKSIGDEIEVTFYRDGKKETTTFKLGEKAED
ncbi:trypsin-like peptidase domain-containing protein [Paenibacillus sp. sptzw28]|uniref:S1C family serine protease n=1 Tax=Paenibacillus sp. sptzw28 TaxID=715179 RepID=UPI001C6DD6DE|nr:trypsin-like peptidase domain-containing protein [Paenibacillus sp. sptzw28]QYR21740.1 trypsin-like peptidase domain-containing protein [Paenibacillus sp. sptzw28]